MYISFLCCGVMAPETCISMSVLFRSELVTGLFISFVCALPCGDCNHSLYAFALCLLLVMSTQSNNTSRVMSNMNVKVVFILFPLFFFIVVMTFGYFTTFLLFSNFQLLRCISIICIASSFE